MNDAIEKLDETGVMYNGWSCIVSPHYVRIDSQTCRLRIPMTIFKRFAKWYLEDQAIEK
jgi:hypothetical protein